MARRLRSSCSSSIVDGETELGGLARSELAEHHELQLLQVGVRAQQERIASNRSRPAKDCVRNPCLRSAGESNEFRSEQGSAIIPAFLGTDKHTGAQSLVNRTA